MTSLLLYDPEDEGAARKADAALAADGIMISKLLASCATVEDIHSSTDCILLLPQTPSNLLACWAGYSCATRRLVLVADNEAEVLQPLRRSIRIDRRNSLWPQQLCEAVRSIKGWHRPPAAPADPREFRDWLAEDVTRLEHLSAADYERLFATFFSRFDCTIEPSDAGLVLSDDRYDRRLFAQFKFAGLSDIVGIDAIRESAAAVSRYNCDVGIVVSNRDFSAAARAYANDQSPPIWLATRDWFAASVATAVSEPVHHGLDELVKNVFSPSAAAPVSRVSHWWRRMYAEPRRLEGGSVPLHVFIFHQNEADAQEVQKVCDEFAADRRDREPILCTTVDVRQNWRKRFLEAFGDSEVRVVYVDAAGASARRSRARSLATLVTIANDHALHGRISILDDSPQWARLCTPSSLNAAFIRRSADAFRAWLGSVAVEESSHGDSHESGTGMLKRPTAEVVTTSRLQPARQTVK